jgi:predicted nucleic acid-binding protein
VIVAVDSSVLIAALVAWHEHHEPAARNIRTLLQDRTLLLPQHAIIETYSVLTRLPSPHRIAP